MKKGFHPQFIHREGDRYEAGEFSCGLALSKVLQSEFARKCATEVSSFSCRF
jgi:hypothetical protein